MALLDILGVSKYYTPGEAAVRDVTLSLDRGEIVCLLGPSGCGKTTLLRLVAGLEQPDGGRILFNDHDLAGVRPHERGFGMMFQDFALFPHKNVRDNVAFGLRMQGQAREKIKVRVDEMLSLVALTGLGLREISSLSGGEQQRVALARALAPGPQLLMLDEPLGALDRALRERLMLDVRAILKQVGMTAIYVTHDQTEAFAVGDRLAVMNAGRIEQLGSPQLIHSNPATPFVARFIGFQNLIPGRVMTAGQVETDIGLFTPSITPPPGTNVTLLIKPDLNDFAFTSGQAIDTPNLITGTVDAVSFRGRFSQVWVMSNGRRLLFEEAGDPPVQAGDEVQITVLPEQMQLYES